jgi:hypothetical protein
MQVDELVMSPHAFLKGMREQHLKSLNEVAMRANLQRESGFSVKENGRTVSTLSRKGASLSQRGCERTARS